MAVEAIPILCSTAVALLSFILTTALLRTFLSFKKTPLYVYICSWVGYFFSICILFLIPLDVAVTESLSCEVYAHNKSLENVTGLLWSNASLNPYLAPTVDFNNETNSFCDRPFNFIKPGSLEIVWNLIYWVCFVSTWVVFPLMGSYVTAGDFTIATKFKAAILENVILGSIALGVCFVLWLIIFFGFNDDDTNAIQQAVMTAGGMWGIFVLVCLLGYGLVFVPRKYWRLGDRQSTLMQLQSSLSVLYDDVEDYGFVFEETLKVVRGYDKAIGPSSPLREYMEQILAKCPSEYSSINSTSTETPVGVAVEDVEKGNDVDGQLKEAVTELVTLNARVMWDGHRYSTARILFNETFKEAIALDDVIKARSGGWKKRIEYSLDDFGSSRFAYLLSELDYVWSLVAPGWYRFIGLFCLVMSLTLLYSEMVLFHFPEYSFWAIVIHWTAKHSWLLEFVCVAVVSYIGMCCYAGLFQLKLFSFYQLVPHQQTDENSILFSAAYLSRLVAPIALNFLHVINFANTRVKSPFMKMISVVSSDPIQETLYAYLPLFLLLISLSTMFNLGNKMMKCVGLSQVCCAGEFEKASIETGKNIMEREKQARLLNGGTTLRNLGRATVPSQNQTVIPRKSRELLIEDDERHTDLEKSIEDVNFLKEPSPFQRGVSWFSKLISNASAPAATDSEVQVERRRAERRSSGSGLDLSFPARYRLQTISSSSSSEEFRPTPSSTNPFEGLNAKPDTSINNIYNNTAVTSNSEWDTAALAPRKKYSWESSDSS